MEDNKLMVLCQMDVEFNGVSLLHSSLKSRHGIFRNTQRKVPQSAVRVRLLCEFTETFSFSRGRMNQPQVEKKNQRQNQNRTDYRIHKSKSLLFGTLFYQKIHYF